MQWKETNYDDLYETLEALMDQVPYPIANLSNASALLMQMLDGINWAGFYGMQQNRLVLGPFQGKPACIEIAVGRGVCGTAVALDEVQLVEDVHQFPGHIACDEASRSEIVLPLHRQGVVIGVLDIDSPYPGRFNETDRAGLLRVAAAIERMLEQTAGNACR